MLSNLDSDNLYAALGLERDASESAVREQIGGLYREALANAEHRDLRMRQYYEQLLEVLPRGYNILLDTSKRAQHDAYLDAGYEGSFEQYLEQQGQKTDYGLREREGLLEVRSSPLAAPTPVAAPPPDPQLPSANVEKTTSGLAPQPLLVSVGLGILAFVVARGVLHVPLATAAGIALLVVVALAVIFYLRQRS